MGGLIRIEIAPQIQELGKRDERLSRTSTASPSFGTLELVAKRLGVCVRIIRYSLPQAWNEMDTLSLGSRYLLCLGINSGLLSGGLGLWHHLAWDV